MYVIIMYIYCTNYFYLIDSSGDQCLIALLSEPVKRYKIKVLLELELEFIYFSI
jgi:hypothetical protein